MSQAGTAPIRQSNRTTILAALLIVVVCVLILWSNVYSKPVPALDSSVYLYTGGQILEGKVPYLDTWDHKGPLIYFINTLGLWIGQGSLWGVWLLETAFLVASAWLGFLVLRWLSGYLPALFGSLAWLLALPLVLQGGNRTEEYVLLFHFAAFYLNYRLLEQPGSRLFSFLLGTAFSMSLLLKPNQVGVSAAALLVLLAAGLVQDRRRLFRQLLFVALGGLVPLLAAAAYLWATGALSAFYDSVIRFNLVYSGASHLQRLKTVNYGLTVLNLAGMSLVALAGWILGVWLLWSRWRAYRRFDTRSLLLAVALIAYPLGMVLTSVAGRFYPRYFIEWLPVMAILAALFAETMMGEPASGEQDRGRAAATRLVLLATILLAMGVLQFERLMKPAYQALSGAVESSYDRTVVNTAAYIESHMEASDTLLVWGMDPALHILTQRKCPTRYVYQMPLYIGAYEPEVRIAELAQAVEQARPWIVDTSPDDQKFLPLGVGPVDTVPDWSLGYWEPVWTISPELVDLADFINAHYDVVAVMEPVGWRVLAPETKPPDQ